MKPVKPNVNAAGTSTLDELWARLDRIGIDATRIAASGGGIWLFGSRAAGCSASSSDWDVLLLMGDSTFNEGRRCVAGLDLVYVGRSHAETRWSETDLSTHVLKYGMPLKVASGLQLHADLHRAAARKRQIVEQRADRLSGLWKALSKPQRARESVRLKRDIARLWCLEAGEAVPPTALLRDAWCLSDPISRLRMIRSMPLRGELCRDLTDDFSSLE